MADRPLGLSVSLFVVPPLSLGMQYR